jgi:arylformamidase
MDLEQLRSALSDARWVDLSQTYEEHMPGSPNHAKFFHNLWGSYNLGDRSLNYQLCMSEHGGTHVDAPAHFITDEKPHAQTTVDQIAVNRLVGRGLRVDCSSYKAGTYVTQDFIREWEAKHTALRASDIVLFDFGWASHWRLRPNHQNYLKDWPGIGSDAAEYLVSKRVNAIGVDTLSPDPPDAHRLNRAIHPVILEQQILIIENLTNLSELPEIFTFLAFPLKIRKGSGSPIRAVALI